MPVKAVTFDAYGTLLRNDDLRLVPQRIVADHRLSVPIEDVLRFWIDLYYEATQLPFRTLREIQAQILERVLRRFDVGAYKPHRLVFQRALEQLGVEPHEVLHVGDSDVDDVKGAKAAGLRVAWVNRDGRTRRPDVPQPDFEIRDLTELPALLSRLAQPARRL